MSLEPLGDGLGVPLRQESDGLAAFEIDAHLPDVWRLRSANVHPKDRGMGASGSAS